MRACESVTCHKAGVTRSLTISSSARNFDAMTGSAGAFESPVFSARCSWRPRKGRTRTRMVWSKAIRKTDNSIPVNTRASFPGNRRGNDRISADSSRPTFDRADSVKARRQVRTASQVFGFAGTLLRRHPRVLVIWVRFLGIEFALAGGDSIDGRRSSRIRGSVVWEKLSGRVRSFENSKGHLLVQSRGLLAVECHDKASW